MNIAQLLTPDATCCNAAAVSKKRVLEFVSSFLARHASCIDADALYQALLERERLGSTGIGEGIAIPHCRLPGCDRITGVLVKLEQPVDFDAVDNLPVDLVFALVVPDEQNDEHLQTLAAIAALLEDPEVRSQLRGCGSDEDLYRRAVASA